MSELKSGKRYWFRDRNYVYSGLLTDETDKNENRILLRKNGDVWSIPGRDLYETKELCINSFGNPKILKVIG